MSKTILYIGGFELPDKNAAAQRVIGIAKGLRELGHEVIFLNSLKNSEKNDVIEKQYFGFKCFEYKRESEKNYLLSAKTALSMVRKIKPDIIIAYNYPAVALDRIRRYCKRNGLKVWADATEWYQADGDNLAYRIIKNLDTTYRMRVIQKRLDGLIAISRFLYDYYKDDVKTVMIPPTVDLNEEKWNINVQTKKEVVSFVYAGVPVALKEKLDSIVATIEKVSHEYNVILNVVGVTEKQYIDLYNWSGKIPNAVKFWGRVDHKKVIEIVKASDWAIILRENNRVVKAGFPTKMVEAISCGTPVIVNRFSNVCDYIGEENGIVVEDTSNLEAYIKKACEQKKKPDSKLFDYHSFLTELQELL